MNLIDLFYRSRRKIFYLTHKRKEAAGQPDAAEEARANKLKETINQLTAISLAASTSDAEKVWLQFCLDLREKIKTADPRNFLNWEVVQQTMFHDASYREYRELKNDWKYWSESVKDEKFGNPMPYYLNANSTGNLIHYAYSLEQLRKISLDVKDFDQIVEIGGGYGGMAKLIYRLGFKGKYIIYDLPEFSALQEYYLSSVSEEAAKNTSLVSTPADLKNNFISGKKTLFIATWSLSEMREKTRQEILNALGKIDAYLIAYHIRFGEVDNEKYFSSFLPEEKISLKKNYHIDHLKNNYYLLLTAK